MAEDRDNGATQMSGHEPTYEESVRLGWALLWRGVGSFIVLLFGANVLILSLIPELTRTGPSFWVALLPIGAVTVLCTFLVMPLVVRRLVRLPFRGFHVQFVRDGPREDVRG